MSNAEFPPRDLEITLSISLSRVCFVFCSRQWLYFELIGFLCAENLMKRALNASIASPPNWNCNLCKDNITSSQHCSHTSQARGFLSPGPSASIRAGSHVTYLLTSLCAATFCLRSSSLSTLSLLISSCSLLSWPATTLPSSVTIVTFPDTIS